jgi:pyrimidine deaminase RibD-like protein
MVKPSDFKIINHEKLDAILLQLCEMIIQGQKADPEYYGMVAASVLDNNNNIVNAVNYMKDKDHRVHAERAAIDKYNKLYGPVPQGSIILTTLSPCSDYLDERYGESCTDLIDDIGVHKVYCGYSDPTQNHSDAYMRKKFHVETTKNKRIQELCKKFADTFLDDVD